MIKLGVSYYGNRYLSHAQRDIRRIADCCDYVVHTMSETDLVYSKAALARLCKESKKAGLEIWMDPWGLGGVFGGEAISKFLIDHRDSWQVMSNGQVKPLACLNRPEWRSFMMEWILTARDLGADVIFWDEPHIAFDFDSEWQGVYSCICSVCKNLFKKKYGGAMPSQLTPEARDFRRETMRSFLTEGMAFAKTKGLKNSICLYAFKGNEEYDRVWEEAGALKDLDIFGCDPYWRWHGHHSPKARVAEFSDHTVQMARKNGKGSQIWIQAMRLPSGAEQEIVLACEAAASAGVTHLAAWSYDGGELLDPVLAERPDEVWRVVEETFKKIRAAR